MILHVTGLVGLIGSYFVVYYSGKYQNSIFYLGNLDNLTKLTENQQERHVFIKNEIKNVRKSTQ